MLEPGGTPVCFPRCRGPLGAWLVQDASPAWTWGQGFGGLWWMGHWGSALLSLWETWDFLSVNVCHSDCVVPQPHFKGWCRAAWRPGPDMLLDPLGWYGCLFEDGGGAPTMPVHCIQLLQGTQPEAKAHQVQILPESDQLFGSLHLQRRCAAWQGEPRGCGRVHSAPDLHRNPSLSGLGGSLLAIYWGFACIAQPLHEHPSGEGAYGVNRWVALAEGALDAFVVLGACLGVPVLAFGDLGEPFLLGTNTDSLGLVAVLLQG